MLEVVGRQGSMFATAAFRAKRARVGPLIGGPKR